MNHLHRLGTPSILRWVSTNLVDCPKTPSGFLGSLFHVANNPRFYRIRKTVQAENSTSIHQKISRTSREEAQAALFDYLYQTRSLQFTDAEHMSKNSPNFLERLLTKADSKTDIGHSVSRLLRYHPINEFELFFESSGLKPYEYRPLLPHDLMFLCDDDRLLANYHVLCCYGIARNKIGKIYKEATEVFRYDHGVLESKLHTYEEKGLSQCFMIKVVVCSPYLLIGDVNVDFIKALEILRKAGLEISWIEQHLSEKSTFRWSQLLVLLNLFSKADWSKDQLSGLIRRHPGVLFEGSGDDTLMLIGFLHKFGFLTNQICSMFLQFPPMEIGKFVLNLRRCFMFLNEIQMEPFEIGKIFQSHPLLLGSFQLKTTRSLHRSLKAGRKRLCKFIQENPQEMNKWGRKSTIEPLQDSGSILKAKIQKTKFLLDLGFIESSNEMTKALKVFRGKGDELQERFDCIVKAGLDRKDVCEIVRVHPYILNQSKDLIEMKIDFLVNVLGYPISTLVTCPPYLSYKMERIKLRVAMMNWLKEQGTIGNLVSFTNVVRHAEHLFVNTYVNQHPRGPEIWLDLKKIYFEGQLNVPA